MIECDVELSDHPMVQRVRHVVQDATKFTFSDHNDLFDEILRSDFPLQAVTLGLRKVAENPSYQLPTFTMEGLVRGWKILEATVFRVSIGYRDAIWAGEQDAAPVQRPIDPSAEAPRLEPYPYDLFLGFLSGDEFDIDRYEVVPPVGDQAEHTLRLASTQRMGPGQSILLRAGQDLTISRITGRYVYLEISGSPSCPVLPRFDASDHRFMGWISGDPMTSRIELLTRTIAEFQYEAGTDVLRTLTGHRDHYVRWNSMRHLLRVNADAGLDCIEQAALHDPNHEVRDVAARTLAAVDAR